ncbi:MAG: lipoyl(octanoyl) transferase [Bacteroidetes bacterium RIFCSPLOWO2_02_FULL_36_8]|nr:MAG: lipoyl(octanoyl) transferase [Bacteroidetes bacterium RIFCSPLOWO2_02_FULL_36_8]OFY70330.1 MAG: lipoyl(octanoyl) transferase [Bacteroidetes bacterium RIFCSPLOWO2_12_FULL_37_12]
MTNNQINRSVTLHDLGLIDFKQAWDFQEEQLHKTVKIKIENHRTEKQKNLTENHLILCEHPPVFTLGKSGAENNLLLNKNKLAEKGISYYPINRGGDITFHGPGQLVVYPILDLENFFTDIGLYLRSLEESVILTLAYFGISSGRFPGYTGVWIEPDIPAKARKVCAIGVRSSRWVTMHGLALNVNTDLTFFNYIIPCGIKDKQVTSMKKENGQEFSMKEVKKVFLEKFVEVFGVEYGAS